LFEFFQLSILTVFTKPLYRIPFEKEELCSLTCNILKKEFVPKNNQYTFDNDQFILITKIVKLNPKPLNFMFKDIKQGGKIVLDIIDYGREIDRFKNGITCENVDAIKQNEKGK
jgi:hypothetical protein